MSPIDFQTHTSNLTQEQRVVRGRAMRAGFPKRHRETDFPEMVESVIPAADGWQGTYPAWKTVYDTIQDVVLSGNLHWLLGNPGTGKTQIAVWVGIEACEKANVRFTDAFDLFSSMRDYESAGFSERGEMAGWCKWPLLIIDELDDCRQSTFESLVFKTLINRRYAWQKDTICISNLRNDELLKRLDPKITSRMEEIGHVYECTWPSFRRRRDE